METTSANAKILEFVRDCWSDGKVALLSKIGALESSTVGAFAKTSPSRSLKAYILQNLSDDVRLVSHSNIEGTVSAVPINDDTASIQSFDAYIEKSLPSEATGRPRRFKASVWAAFRKSLPDGLNRFIRFEPYISFRDTGDDNPESDELPIDRPYVAADDHTTDHEVYENVLKWAGDNNVDPGQLVRSPPLRDSGREGDLARADARSVLDAVLVALDDDDLARLSVPLDIVKKLRTKRPR